MFGSSLSKSVTVEEAVANLIYIGELPPGESLLDWTKSECLDAKSEYQKSLKDNLEQHEVERCNIRYKFCESRHNMALHLKRHIEWELRYPSKNKLMRANNSRSISRILMGDLAEWLMEEYQIDYELKSYEYEGYGRHNDIEKKYSNAEATAIDVNERGLSGALARRLYVLIAYLLEVLVEAKKNPTGYGTADKINVHQVAELILQRVQAFKGNTKFYDIETLKSRFEIALAMKRQFGKK